MYTRLIIAVLIVAAVVNTATAQSTVNSTTTLNATTTAPSNSSGATSNATTAAPSGSTGATSNATTAAPSGSTGPSNTTASNATTTTQGPTTTVLNPVGVLTSSISRTGCGSQQLCLTQPASCDPSISGSCYFISSQQLSGQTYQLGLSGSSPGYIATALSTGSTVGNNDTAFVCANNNGMVQFFTANFLGNVLQTTSLSVNSVKGSVSGNKIQCVFSATLPAGSNKALNFQVGFLTGNYTNGTLGNASIIFQQPADLSNPSSHAITFKQSLAQAVLIVAVALGLTM